MEEQEGPSLGVVTSAGCLIRDSTFRNSLSKKKATYDKNSVALQNMIIIFACEDSYRATDPHDTEARLELKWL